MASLTGASGARTEPRATFLVTSDLDPRSRTWLLAQDQLRAVTSSCASILGFEPELRLAPLGEPLEESICRAAMGGAGELFVLPVAFDLDLLQREGLGRVLSEARRNHPHLAVHHDDVDPGQSLVVDAFADQVSQGLGSANPKHCGLILAPGGHGDVGSRAQSYRLMRLIWERLSLAAAEVGFIRHTQPFLLATLEKCARDSRLWIVLPQSQWRTEHRDFAETILTNFQRSHPESAGWRMAEPPAGHPAITAWLTQRIVRLWREKRSREAVRMVSPKRAIPAAPRSWTLGAGTIAQAGDRQAMAGLLERILPAGKPERVLVKVTWHGYTTGTYTDPGALDLLLSALPAKAVVLEGHTSSRNLGGAAFDWEREARENRAWIRQQDAEYLRRTGLADVLARHQALYLNVTEAFWDGGCAAAERVNGILHKSGVSLSLPEFAQFVPEVLLDFIGRPMISFAKFKGPTRLAISNMFGLLPEPLRASWHGGPNITYFARVCCELAKLYGSLFPLCGVNEALYTAVRWNRQGLYRSRWGNYDLISNAGYLAAGRNLVVADILASRLQGQDVARSAFFDVVRAQLGWDEQAANRLFARTSADLLRLEFVPQRELHGARTRDVLKLSERQRRAERQARVVKIHVVEGIECFGAKLKALAVPRQLEHFGQREIRIEKRRQPYGGAGSAKVIWLRNGIVGDDTHGHIDDIARFVAEDAVVAAWENNRNDPNYAPLRENHDLLRASGLRVIRLPMPQPLYFAGRRLPASYANFYIANGLVLVPTFNDPNDRTALSVLAKALPDREVTGINCTELIWGLGALHCMTQQQPAESRATSD